MRLLAIGLAFTDDIVEAGRLAGVSGEDLAALATEARSKHPGLVRLDRRELAAAGEALIGLALLHALGRIATSDSSPHGLISIAERASALLEKITGRARNLFSEVSVVFAWDDNTEPGSSKAELIGTERETS